MLAYEVGLLPHEFYALTPAEFGLVCEGRMKALVERENRAFQRTGAMMALYANANHDFKKHPRMRFTADDFFGVPSDDAPAGKPARGRGTRKAQTPEQMVRAAELITRAFGGKDKRRKQDAATPAAAEEEVERG